MANNRTGGWSKHQAAIYRSMKPLQERENGLALSTYPYQAWKNMKVPVRIYGPIREDDERY